MNMRRLAAVARKEFLHVIRDPRSVILAIALPMTMLLLFGYALTLDVDHVPMVVWDQSRTPQSREYLSTFTLSRYFDIVSYVTSYREVERAIDKREALVAVVIPSDFAQGLARGSVVPVQAIVDGSDPNTATLAMGYARLATLIYSQQVTVSMLQRRGIDAPETPVDSRPRVWFNTDMESRNFIIPGLIAVIMMVIAALLTSLAVSREWERGTMEQLIATPVKGTELIVGKMIPYFCIGILDVVIAMLMGQFLFGVPLRGSPALALLFSSVFLIGALGMGITISVVTKNQLLSTQMAMLSTYLPSFLLSGYLFPIANMPKVIQLVTYVVPAKYFIVIIRNVYLKGLGPEIMLLDILLLCVFAVVIVSIAAKAFKKKLD